MDQLGAWQADFYYSNSITSDSCFGNRFENEKAEVGLNLLPAVFSTFSLAAKVSKAIFFSMMFRYDPDKK